MRSASDIDTTQSQARSRPARMGRKSVWAASQQSATALGKLHFHRAEDVPTLYPRIHDLRVIRRRMEPAGRFLNDCLRSPFA